MKKMIVIKNIVTLLLIFYCVSTTLSNDNYPIVQQICVPMIFFISILCYIIFIFDAFSEYNNIKIF